MKSPFCVVRVNRHLLFIITFVTVVAGPAALRGQGAYFFTKVADTNGPFSDFGGSPSVSDSGIVTFVAFLDAGGLGIFTGSDGPTRTIN